MLQSQAPQIYIVYSRAQLLMVPFLFFQLSQKTTGTLTARIMFILHVWYDLFCNDSVCNRTLFFIFEGMKLGADKSVSF